MCLALSWSSALTTVHQAADFVAACRTGATGGITSPARVKEADTLGMRDAPCHCEFFELIHVVSVHVSVAVCFHSGSLQHVMTRPVV